MQASELYEIVRDVPREAWPREVKFAANLWKFETSVSPTVTQSHFMPTDLAEAAFVGSMTAWMIHRGRLTLRGNVFAGVVAYAIVEIEPIEPTGANTLVAALAAACKEVNSNGN
jgi:hypothetical protein